MSLTLGRRRITPACAGNSILRRSSLSVVRDHPRVCGEQLRSLKYHGRLMGSPPRVRGTERLSGLLMKIRRITPACAGNSGLQESDHGEHRDHPRVCGEQLTPSIVTTMLVGSPPRVRGTVFLWRWLFYDTGITPACAGNRRLLQPVYFGFWDHPRVCGEQSAQSLSPWASWGSPPRVRGTDFC